MDIGEDTNPLAPNARGSRAACSDEVWEGRQRSPHDIQMQRILEDMEYRQSLQNPDTASVRYAWRQLLTAYGTLFKALRHWIGLKQCQFFWHATSDGMWGHRVCRRCGAWRD